MLIKSKCPNNIDDGHLPWTGIGFTIRDKINDYDTVDDWEEDYNHVIEYVYRDFNDGGSPDVISGEFALLYAGESKPITDLLIANQDLMFIYEIQNRRHKRTTVLEKIAIYIHENRYSLFH
jgi:hypothetical protein